MRLLVPCLSFALAACPSQQEAVVAPSVFVSPPPSAQPVASAAAPVAPAAGDLPTKLQCGQDLGRPIASGRSGVPKATPEPGQMTEQAAQAKRLFDAEKWSESIVALQAVADGSSGDDEGNKQLAEYHRAIALYRSNRPSEAYAAFHAIANDRGHTKHGPTLLWIAKFLTDQPALVDLADLSSYTREDVDRFNNEPQREVWGTLIYMLGRERLQEGDRAEARAMFLVVPGSHRLAAYAKQCFEMTR